jgi:hypothetical protein
MMVRLALAVLLALAPVGPATAEPDWLTPEEFEARVTGKATQVYDEYGDLFGTEFFLPDRRVIWVYGGTDDCLTGRWKPQRELVCYIYDDGQENCLRYYHDNQDLGGIDWYDGAPSGGPFVFKIVDAPLPSCTAGSS